MSMSEKKVNLKIFWSLFSYRKRKRASGAPGSKMTPKNREWAPHHITTLPHPYASLSQLTGVLPLAAFFPTLFVWRKGSGPGTTGGLELLILTNSLQGRLILLPLERKVRYYPYLGWLFKCISVWDKSKQLPSKANSGRPSAIQLPLSTYSLRYGRYIIVWFLEIEKSSTSFDSSR